MTVEVATKISELVAENPAGSDPKSEGDNHLRLIKGVLQDVFDDSGDTLKTTLPVESPDGAVFGTASFAEIDVDQIDTKIVNPLEIVDAADKVRATIAADETAATGGVTITAFDDAGTPDQEAQLAILPTVLRYSGDDATRIFELDQSRQATATTRKLYVPAKPVDGSFSLWEPIFSGQLSGAAQYDFLDLGAFYFLRMTLFSVPTNATSIQLRTSSNNGASFDAGANDYRVQVLNAQGNAASAAVAGQTSAQLAQSIDANTGAISEAILAGFGIGTVMRGVVRSQSASGEIVLANMGIVRNQATARNALRIFVPVGTFNMRLAMEGIRT